MGLRLAPSPDNTIMEIRGPCRIILQFSASFCTPRRTARRSGSTVAGWLRRCQQNNVRTPDARPLGNRMPNKKRNNKTKNNKATKLDCLLADLFVATVEEKDMLVLCTNSKKNNEKQQWTQKIKTNRNKK